MRISAKAEYACLAVIELAESAGDGSPKRIRDIAKAQRIPEPYLIKILLQLKAAGLVHSARGSVGGYQLARNPTEISVADVIAAIEGRIEPLCKGDTPAARNLLDVLVRAHSAEWNILGSCTIAHLARHVAFLDWVL
jgi:Rrf2 family cysteine metabolism transcriptional repressor